MSRVRLTERSVAALKPKEKRYDVSDSLRVGLRVRVAPSGLKTWVFEKRIRGGPLRSHTLGRFPVISLSEAREKALGLEKEAMEGFDRKAEAEKRKSVLEVLDDYEQKHLVQLRTGKERRRQLDNALKKHFRKPISSLERRELQAFIDGVADSGAKVLANRYKAAISAFTGFAWRRGYTEQNVGAGLSNATRERPRDRVLSLKEVRAIYEASEFLSPLWTPLIRLLILTAQRRSDITGLREGEVDFEKRRIDLPSVRTKNGKPHIVHLSDPALDIVSGIEPKNGLYFSTTGKTPVSGLSKVKKQLDGLLPDDMEPWTLHDLRTAFATTMAETGASEGVVDRILNHAASGSAASAVARVYNQSQQLKPRAAVLDHWAALVTQESADVVRIAS
ncbi:tyrosine-type recombinase/integrase [Ruegeria arenilitoris]|uniref:tyrosine-type recombinase/integrase n=1 Tax=Ruegeria arenilitoris TaxID=1173585 RepID=UPI00147BDB15|nr:integrase family protein [Ruegeria arenilitoris]